MIARIYKPTKTAMQSVIARTKPWVWESPPASPRADDPPLGAARARPPRSTAPRGCDRQHPAAVLPDHLDTRVFEHQINGLGEPPDLFGGKVRVVVKVYDQSLRGT